MVHQTRPFPLGNEREISIPVSCRNCNRQVGIVEYYNTDADHQTIREIMSLHKAKSDIGEDYIERIDCIECQEIVYQER